MQDAGPAAKQVTVGDDFYKLSSSDVHAAAEVPQRTWRAHLAHTNYGARVHCRGDGCGQALKAGSPCLVLALPKAEVFLVHGRKWVPGGPVGIFACSAACAGNLSTKRLLQDATALPPLPHRLPLTRVVRDNDCLGSRPMAGNRRGPWIVYGGGSGY